MNCLTRATHVINSTTSFQCVTKSLHVFTNLTSQVDLTKRTCFATKEPTQRGGSVPRNLGRNSSNYCIHPEKLRQIIKERDGHLLCSFFDSEDYKSKVTEFSQKQKQIISQGTPAGVNDEDIRYEHVLNCAQPLRCRKEFIVEKPDAKVSEVRFKYEKERVPKKITIMSAILKKKNAEDSKKMIHMPERKKSPILPTVKRTKLQVKDYPKRYKKTSTILPIYLRKMERNIERKHQQQENEESKPRTFYRDTAKKVFDTDSVDYKKQALNVRNYDANYGRRIRQDEMEMEEEEESEDRRIRDSRAKARAERERYVRDSPRKGALVYPDLKLVEYSIYDPRYSKAWPPRTEQTRPHQLEPTRRHVIDGSWPPRKKKNLKIEEHTEEPTRKFRAGGHSDNELFTKGIVIEEPKPDPATKKSLSEPSTQMEKDPDRVDHVTQMKTALKKQWSFLTKKLSRRKIKKMAKLSEGTKENLPAISEFELERPIDTSDLNKVRRRNMSTYGTRPRDDMVIDDVLTLYQKVKSGTCKEPFADKPCKYPFEHKEERNMDSSGGPSETYKVVADSKTRRSAELRNKYDLAETEHVRIEFVRKSKEDTERRIEVQKADKNVGRSTISFVDSGKRLADVTRDNVGSYADAVKENRESRRYAKKVSRLGTPSMPFNEYRKKSVDRESESFPGSKSDDYEENRKLGRRITRPPMPFVDFVKKDDGSLYNRTFARYLVRLPKTTPEGYRILMYSVRDSDPTKMNFSDCIKGFCMYNDCVLSEDGLQEGYIVIFDMKGVQIGHLARVSLPALRCFLLYIQEAHPCRLKSIHVLNTASWIHHIMRLIVPLVKSEILNLVKFHKGSVPEGFPLELLPMDLGGEAPNIEDLDRETKSLIHKYRDWLIETAEFKSDESKRAKKASWWGFFNGSNKTNNELDEKTILKNLQVD